jgi:hypothetical protein
VKNISLILIIFLILLLISTSCKTEKKSQVKPNENKKESFMNPPVIIYKTKQDYFYHVPVGLSQDKKTIISYPDKADLFYAGQLATPTRLADGYLLDNRGIGVNSAFLKFTYEEYAKFPATPTVLSLFFQIIDKEPFTEMYSCKCDRDTATINNMIRTGLLKTCKKIK